MDPNAVYSGSVTYYLQIKGIDRPVVSSLYNSILDDTEVFEEIRQAGGLDCSLHARQELVEIQLREQKFFPEDLPVSVQASASAITPEAETCQSILELLA